MIEYFLKDTQHLFAINYFHKSTLSSVFDNCGFVHNQQRNPNKELILFKKKSSTET